MINNITLMGRITHTPELKKTPSGTSVLNFSMAVDRRFTSGKEKITDFLDCVAWSNQAEFIAKYFKKGDMIAVIGEVQTREYENRDGNKRKAVEIVISNVSFCGGKAETKAPEATEPAITEPEKTEPTLTVTDDELPF